MYTRTRNKKATALIMVVSVMMVLSVVGVSFARVASLERLASVNYVDNVSARWLAIAGADCAVLKLIQTVKDTVGDPNNSGNWNYMVNLGNTNVGSVNGAWRYYVPDGDATEDNIGVGVPLSEAYSLVDARSPSYKRATNPSYGGVQRKITGAVGSDDRVYTLKIIDTTAQINLNSHIEANDPADSDSSHPTTIDTVGAPSAYRTMLRNLSRAIAERKPYSVDFAGDTVGPLTDTIITNILTTRRDMGGFRSKFDLLQVDGFEAIARYVWDYVTVYPTPQQIWDETATPARVRNNHNIYQTVRPTTWTNEAFATDYRSPININTAPWPVLVAMLANLQMNGGNTNTIVSYDMAKALAYRICYRRRTTSLFKDWDGFADFLEKQKVASAGGYNNNEVGAFVTEWSDTAKREDINNRIALIKANCEINVTLRKINPDRATYQKINKTDLTHYTSEMCFFPLGVFEITSLGQVIRPDGTIQAANEYFTIARIYDVMLHSTQRDFESGLLARADMYPHTDKPTFLGARKNTTVAGSTACNSFSYPNNLQDTAATDASNDANPNFGYLQPLSFNIPLSYPLQDSSSTYRDHNDLYWFKCDFNGTLTPNLYQNSTAPGGSYTTTAFPDFVADGVVFRSGETRELYFTSRPSNSGNGNGNFPPMRSGSGNDNNGSVNDGTWMFWFKINSSWPLGEWRTVALSTTYYKVEEWFIIPLYNEYLCVQREVRMRVSGPQSDFQTSYTGTVDTQVDKNAPFLRTLEIQVRHKFASNYWGLLSGNIDPVNPSNATGFVDLSGVNLWPYGNRAVDYAARMVLSPVGKVNPDVATIARQHKRGIHTQEWYHLVVRWEDGMNLRDFTGEDNNHNMPINVSGNFYELNGTTETCRHTGPLWSRDDAHELFSFYIKPDGTLLGDSDNDGNMDAPYHAHTYSGQSVGCCLPYKDNVDNSHFYALDTSKRQSNVFYVGYVPGATGGAPDMTVDDIRVYRSPILSSTATTGSSTEGYMISRVPRPYTNNDYRYGLMYGKFEVADAGNSEYLAHYFNSKRFTTSVGLQQLAQRARNYADGRLTDRYNDTNSRLGSGSGSEQKNVTDQINNDKNAISTRFSDLVTLFNDAIADTDLTPDKINNVINQVTSAKNDLVNDVNATKSALNASLSNAKSTLTTNLQNNRNNLANSYITPAINEANAQGQSNGVATQLQQAVDQVDNKVGNPVDIYNKINDAISELNKIDDVANELNALQTLINGLQSVSGDPDAFKNKLQSDGASSLNQVQTDAFAKAEAAKNDINPEIEDARTYAGGKIQDAESQALTHIGNAQAQIDVDLDYVGEPGTPYVTLTKTGANIYNYSVTFPEATELGFDAIKVYPRYGTHIIDEIILVYRSNRFRMTYLDYCEKYFDF